MGRTEDRRVFFWSPRVAGSARATSITDAVALTGADVDHGCALRKSGTVACWGSNADGMIEAPAAAENASRPGAGARPRPRPRPD